MTERKPPGMSWESFAEHKIREAQQAGAFDDLPGMGQPIPGIDDPPDENWWIKQMLRREGLSVLPPILQARLAVEKTLQIIWSLHSEADVRRRLEALNDVIHAAHFSTVQGPPDGVRPVDIEAVVAAWKEQRRDQQRADPQ